MKLRGLALGFLVSLLSNAEELKTSTNPVPKIFRPKFVPILNPVADKTLKDLNSARSIPFAFAPSDKEGKMKITEVFTEGSIIYFEQQGRKKVKKQIKLEENAEIPLELIDELLKQPTPESHNR